MGTQFIKYFAVGAGSVAAGMFIPFGGDSWIISVAIMGAIGMGIAMLLRVSPVVGAIAAIVGAMFGLPLAIVVFPGYASSVSQQTDTTAGKAQALALAAGSSGAVSGVIGILAARFAS